MLTRRLLIILAFLLVLAAPAYPAAGWAPTAGPMSDPRWLHEAVLLDNGKVLIAGGFSTVRPTEVLGSVELYDPASGTFSPGPPMITPRAQFGMTKLPDGRVLAVGGVTGQYGATVLPSAEVYDPRTNRWSGVPGLQAARRDLALIPLPSGKVLAAGGTFFDANASSTPVRLTELFDPAHDVWTGAGDTTAPRNGAVGVALADGRVVLAGGSQLDGSAATSELWAGGWSAGGALAYGHELAGIGLLPDGRPLITGGYGLSPNSYAPSAEVFTDGQWRRAAPPVEGRASHTQTTLVSGRVLITGGQAPRKILASTEVYDPVSNAWSSAGPMYSPRVSHAATLLSDGRVLVTGGVVGDTPSGAVTAEVYTAPTTISVASTLAIGARKVGLSGASALQLTNTGDSPLFLTANGITGTQAGDFGADATRCQAVAPGAACTVNVSFTPSGFGAREAVLTLNANTSPAFVAVNLTGAGVADTDGDGITDDVDRCARRKGTAARQGCPAGLLADPSIRYRAGKRSIRVIAYSVKATKGAKLTVTCSRGCKKTTTKGKGAKRRIRITRLDGRSLRNGTKITVTASMKGRLTTTVVDRISKGRRIEGRPQCAPVRC